MFSNFKTVQRRTRVNPRLDYQLNANNTLSVHYGFTRGDIQGAGIGGFNLISRGYHLHYVTETVHAIETHVHGATVNETRFQFYRNGLQQTADSTGPAILVLGAFNGGASTIGQTFDTGTNYEFQNYTVSVHEAHTVRFGVRIRAQIDENSSPQNFNGTFTFAGGLAPALNSANQPIVDASGNPVLQQINALTQYQRTLYFQQMGLSPAAIRARGGGASQFTISGGQPALTVNQVDEGIFAGDDWRVRPNLTLNLGIRYENQNNISDWRNIAPRIGLAWAPGATASKPRQTTVFRAGFGMFYDRFSLGNTLTAERYNGIVQQQYVIVNPDFFPNVPPPSSLASFQSPQVIQEISSDLRAPYVMQSALTVERQLPHNTTLAVTYTNTHGLHMLRSRDLNAPLPGSGLFPFGNSNPIFLMESSGIYNQNQILVNMATKVSAGISLNGSYVLNKAMSNTDGVGTFPANPYSYAGEYGPASTDVRQRVNLSGTINTKWNVRFSPLSVAAIGPTLRHHYRQRFVRDDPV